VPRSFGANVSANRASAIMTYSKTWTNGTTLHYCFLTGEFGTDDETQKQMVRDSWKQWHDLGLGIKFVEVTDPNSAEIRIAFQQTGSWSTVGRDCLTVPKSEPTMNFGWDLRLQPDTSLHEIGHALGFQHEHQNPKAGIVWDEQAVYANLGAPPNSWTTEETDNNVLRKLDPSTVRGTNWDRDSIMEYPFAAGLIIKPPEYQTQPLQPKGGLSPSDIAVVKKFYPGQTSPQLPLLKPFESQKLALNAGESTIFRVEPEVTGKHTIETFGSSDVVLVLFEQEAATNKYITAEDDSGLEKNAKLECKLVKGKKYQVSLRLYSKYDSGITAIMITHA